jgi:hypothetical protein
MPREDAICPACPDPEAAFRLEDVGMKLLSESLDPDAGALHIKVTRPAWEVVMLKHLRSTDDEEHRRIYDQCVTALMTTGVSAEEAARNSVQAVADSARHLLEHTIRRGHP